MVIITLGLVGLAAIGIGGDEFLIDSDRRGVIVNGVIIIAFGAVDIDAVAVEDGVVGKAVRIALNRLGNIGDRAVIIAFDLVELATIGVGVCKFRIEPYGL